MSKSRHTPARWRWVLNKHSKQIDLVSSGVPGSVHEIVMDFVRWGMGGAAPRFRRASLNRPENVLMVRADEFGEIVPGRSHHKDWYQWLRHPDAQLIQAAPELYEALDELWEAVKAYDRIGFEGSRLLEAMSDACLALDHAVGERLDQS